VKTHSDRARAAKEDFRDDDMFVVDEVLADPFGVRRLQLIVELDIYVL
jgi:hypothetical protein